MHKALDVLGKGATFYSLQHDSPARIDFYRARVVDGLGQVIHERLFAVEIAEDGAPRLQEPRSARQLRARGPAGRDADGRGASRGDELAARASAGAVP